MGGWLLYLIVSVSGASVLAIEIVGTRILGPFYGVSQFLWSALISVTLAALSVGYALGGRLADRHPGADRLAVILAAAGAWTLAVPWLRGTVISLVAPLGLRPAVLLAAVVLFAVPLTLLGMVSPWAVRLRARSMGEVGRAAGDLYAVSTVASVIAALAVGFVLIPGMGVRRLTLLVGALLLIAAGIAAAAGRRTRGGTALSVGCFLLAGLSGPALGPSRARTGPGLLEVQEGRYAELRVVERDERRLLLIDGAIHTAVDAVSLAPAAPYVVATDIARMFFDRPRRALVVGLGGGSVARQFAHAGWTVDAVEIDPGVVAMARRWFGLREQDAAVAVMDGRRYLLEHEGPWEVIVLDAYGSGTIPFHLATREYFSLVRSRLAPGGVVALNLETVGWDSALLRAVAATLRQEFPVVAALPTMEPPDALGNVVLLAAGRPLELAANAIPHPAEYAEDGYQHWMVLHLNHAWDNRYEPATGGALLTDDRNPADLLGEPVNLASRRSLHARFARTELGW